MIHEILEKLSKDEDAITGLLSFFQCDKVKITNREIRFARDNEPNSGLNISLRLTNNEACLVRDFARNYSTNIISWICNEKNVSFRDVLNEIKILLNLSHDWKPVERHRLFGGVYDSITSRTEPECKSYEESILDNYVQIPNERFLNDNISLKVQRKYKIGYDVETNRIIIPIRNQYGEIIGIKGRRNYHTDDELDPKYLYLVPCRMSSTLFGYSDNYNLMYGNTIFIFESEKSVLQCATYGFDCAVALGSNSISEKQAKMILELRPSAIFWMLDESLPKDITIKNAKIVNDMCSMVNVKQYWWDYSNDVDIEVGSKVSPSDLGRDKLEEIITSEMEELIFIEEEDDEL